MLSPPWQLIAERLGPAYQPTTVSAKPPIFSLWQAMRLPYACHRAWCWSHVVPVRDQPTLANMHAMSQTDRSRTIEGLSVHMILDAPFDLE
jgi:hypothetical protein